MRSIIQKRFILKLFVTAGLLLATLVVPAVHISVASAAVPDTTGATCMTQSKCPVQPAGTCFAIQQGQGNSIDKCTKFGIQSTAKVTGGKYQGDTVDFFKYCYDLTAGLSTYSLVRVGCDNTSLDAPAVQMCDVKGKSVPCQYCPDGSLTDASNDPATGCGDQTAPADTDCSTGLGSCRLVQTYLQPFMKFLSAFVGLAVVISVIVGGIQYSSSAGDPQKASAAKNRIRNAIIALVTYIFLFALLNFLIPGGLV